MEIAALLEAFRARRRAGPIDDPYVSTYGSGGAHLVIGSVVHGDEVGSLPAVIRVMEAIDAGALTVPGRLTIFLGNPEAALAGRRFLETDLNRMFVPEPPDTLEGRRSRVLRRVLDDADVFIDLHQTILPTTQPFWIFPFQIPGWRWARALGTASVWVTRHPEQNFSLEGCCADEYVRLAGKPGITIELSQRGLRPEAEARAWATITRALQIAAALADGAPFGPLAEASPEITFYETAHREPFHSGALALRPGLANFLPVEAGELMSAEGTPEIRAPYGGCILFPKYPPRGADGQYTGPLPGEIYRVIRPLAAHPLDLYGMRGQEREA
jgi:succinylglutamate desuccinylase